MLRLTLPSAVSSGAGPPIPPGRQERAKRVGRLDYPPCCLAPSATCQGAPKFLSWVARLMGSSSSTPRQGWEGCRSSQLGSWAPVYSVPHCGTAGKPRRPPGLFPVCEEGSSPARSGSPGAGMCHPPPTVPRPTAQAARARCRALTAGRTRMLAAPLRVCIGSGQPLRTLSTLLRVHPPDHAPSRPHLASLLPRPVLRCHVVTFFRISGATAPIQEPPGIALDLGWTQGLPLAPTHHSGSATSRAPRGNRPPSVTGSPRIYP